MILSDFFATPKDTNDKEWEMLIAKETTFKFAVRSHNLRKIYERIQELKKLTAAEINILSKDEATSNRDLQIIINVPCLLKKLDNESLAKHVENFVAIAELMIEHPEKATAVHDIRKSIIERFPWLETTILESQLAQSLTTPRLNHF